jgi:type I restriction enzyme S subunit
LFPSPSEQRSILAELKRLTRNEDRAISRLEREIELLREYRTRLVADVVTGKLDVRGAVVHLPEEAPCEALAPDDSDGLDEVELSDVEVAA